MILRCGEQYRRRYVLGEIVPPAGTLIRGRCCHKAEETNFNNKISTKEFLPVEAVKDKFSDEWKQNEGQIGWTEEELGGDSPKTASGKMKDSGVRLIEVFHKEQLVNCDPMLTEKEFTIEFEGGYKPMIGYIDRVDHNDVIADMKFVKKSPVSDDIVEDVQMTSYDLGYRTLFNKPPAKLIKQWSVDTKEPKTVIQECPPRDDKCIQRFLRRLELAMGCLEKGTFLPAPNGAWWCDRRYCGYYDTCLVRP